MLDSQASNLVTSENRAEFMAQRLGLDKVTEKPVEVTEKVPEIVKEVTKEAKSDEIVEESDDADDEHKEKVKNSYIKLREQRNAAREEALTAKTEKAALEAKIKLYEETKPTATKDAPASDKPLPSQYTDAFEYAEALTDWKVKAELSKRDEQAKVTAQEAHQTEVLADWNTRLLKTKQETPDYNEVIAESSVMVSDQVRDAIMESDVGPQVLYYLAGNPEEATKLGQMTLDKAYKTLGRIEAKFDAPAKTEEVKAKPNISKAPAPITPLKNASVPAEKVDENGEFHGSIAEYKALRKAGKIK
jgi:hypothetical protein